MGSTRYRVVVEGFLSKEFAQALADRISIGLPNSLIVITEGYDEQ